MSGLILSACYFNLDVDLGALTAVTPLQEKVVMGEEGPKLVLLEVDGMIGEEPSTNLVGTPRPSMVARIQEALKLARKDSEVKGLILRIRSPGGTTTASETVYHMVLKYREETGEPVIAFLHGLATSGGYYVAMAADRVIAHPTTITGSIGVIMQGINVSGLFTRFGVQDQTFTSGKYKDSGSPWRPMREDERVYLQGIVDDLEVRFQEVVVEGRPAIGDERVAELANGRVFTARQALDNGLIDAIGHLEDAVEVAQQRAGIEQARVVTYARADEYRNNIYSRMGRGMGPPVNVVDVDLFSFGGRPLAPGFYYLWYPAVPGD